MAENDGKVYIDWDDGIKRVMNNVKLYVKMLDKIKTSPYLDNLSTALDAQDYVKAENEAHTLKGVAANLSLMELYRQSIEVDEQLKGGSIKDGALEALKTCYAETLVSIDKAIAAHG